MSEHNETNIELRDSKVSSLHGGGMEPCTREAQHRFHTIHIRNLSHETYEKLWMLRYAYGCKSWVELLDKIADKLIDEVIEERWK